MSSNTPNESQKQKLNVPNVLSFLRLAGSVVLVFVALAEKTDLFLWLFVFLLMTDWVDGKLAILLKQQTTFGARLDSVADVSMYTALLFGTCWLKWDLIQQEAPWLIAAVISYVLTSAAGLYKYGRIPSYHTRAAKTCWFLVGVSAICVFADWSVWPLRITALGGVLTNLEAIAITLVLPEWTADVTSIYHAIKRKLPEAETDLSTKPDDASS